MSYSWSIRQFAHDRPANDGPSPDDEPKRRRGTWARVDAASSKKRSRTTDRTSRTQTFQRNGQDSFLRLLSAV
ncbi:hypothetical protein PG997_002128 [Apiospora hydei]|uniref:DUF397 domain-containing protein n=1 Tax=Apiospora hydei TaxID=1337664 RepID=A0ABR1X8I9_9PEZI